MVAKEFLIEESSAKKKNYKVWADIGLLNGDGDEFFKENLAVLLENSRNDSDGSASFRRISIPATVRIFRTLLSHKLVSIQPLLYRDWFYHYSSGNREYITDIKVHTSALKTVWDGRDFDNLSAEIIMLSIFAEQAKSEIDKNILSELRVYSGHSLEWNYIDDKRDTHKGKYAGLRETINKISDAIAKSTRRDGANWMVTSPEVVNYIAECDNSYINGYIGDGIAIYENSAAPKNEILLGYRGKNYLDSGYVFCPYQLIKPSGNGLSLVAGKAFAPQGSAFYGVIKIKGLVP